MKRFTIVLVFLSLTLLICDAFPVYYKEQYYKLFHIHYIQYPDDTIENIYWLEKARNADFCNPLYALAKIPDEKHWEKYRYLFNMHIELKLIEQHMYLGSKYDKQVAYFYNAPWKKENLESLQIAETAYRAALAYWKTAVEWSQKAEKLRFIHLPEIQYWEDESYRISQGELNYARIIERELERLQKVRAAFMAMDENSY
ncbi:MAG TPA: hypothetical protein P5519_07910 [Spirochaetia bacterium]|nr:hypothetical protein [Spirochaetales bacterium]HRS65801.1 hypothetical protein [Spirochaetia bacterium]HOT59174.1 hypothetical protein [Spirochaetales bacterium]HPD81289.1 hypothetical protein [Spirochaetales bacterium]HQG40181.1 hypothetical protein [Spirochaetales bacterium]